MPNLQPIIDNAHLILPSIVVLCWLLPGIFAAIGKLVPGNDWFERTGPKIQWFAEEFAKFRNLYSRAQEELGLPKLPGQDKAAEVERLTVQANELISQGKLPQALALLAGYKAGAVDKAQKAGLLPFSLSGGVILPTIPPLPQASGDGLDLTEKPAMVNGTLVDPNVPASPGK